MSRRAAIAGGGIGGLAAALACARAGFDEVCLFERAAAFSEVGAGIQLGPNATRVLLRWGLGDALGEVAAVPARLRVRNAHDGRPIGTLAFDAAFRERYRAPYLTIHRADLHALLLAAVCANAAVRLAAGEAVESFEQHADDVGVRTSGGADLRAALLIGADGLWSRVRAQLLGDGAPRATGHVAYRALLPQARLAERLRTHDVNVWLGRRLHVVAYPVRRGEWLNLVGIVHAPRSGPPAAMMRLPGWDHATDARELRAALAGGCAVLRDLVDAVAEWRLWALSDRAPMRGAHEHARGLVALVGDAAHPMLPYLAQGAGMALEDAAGLERALSPSADAGAVHGDSDDVAARLARFAATRWRRNARVQARAARNGRIFHAAGPLAWGRDASIALLGARLLDLPWLYGGG